MYSSDRKLRLHFFENSLLTVCSKFILGTDFYSVVTTTMLVTQGSSVASQNFTVLSVSICFQLLPLLLSLTISDQFFVAIILPVQSGDGRYTFNLNTQEAETKAGGSL